jgi:hypothetical protein
MIARILERGVRLGLFRRDVDPFDLYVSICALGFIYFANRHTLGAIFARDLMSPEMLARRRQAIVAMVLGYLHGDAPAVPASARKPKLLEPLAL